MNGAFKMWREELMKPSLIFLFVGLILMSSLTLTTAKRREKRLIWLTEEKRLVLPPGTQLVLTPTLAMPLLRYPPTGIDANITISTPFTSERDLCFLISF